MTEMTQQVSFRGATVVSCGTLRCELRHLRETGFLDADDILYTAPGLHENLNGLHDQLIKRLHDAAERSSRVIVVYGDSCYLPRELDELLTDEAEQLGVTITCTEARHCVDMLADKATRDAIAGERTIYWLPAGWFEYRKAVFRFWDDGLANETFPRHDAAIMLDPLGVFDEYAGEAPEKLLAFSDWMGIPLEPYPVSLDRFKAVLGACATT